MTITDFALSEFVFTAFLRASVLLLAALVAMSLLCRASAALRHHCSLAVFSALLLLPVLMLLLPQWRFLPGWTRWAGAPGQVAVVERGLNEKVNERGQPAAGEETAAGGGPVAGDDTEAGKMVAADVSAPIPLGERPSSAASSAESMAATASGGSSRWVEFAARSLGIVWLVGAALLFARLAACRAVLARLWRNSRAATDGHLLEQVRDLSQALGVRREVQVRLSSERSVPMTWGALSPRILLPAEFALWSDARQRAVLQHELAHVSRWDAASQLLAQTACAMYWLHPLVWLVARRMNVQREQACDDLVLGGGVRASDYATHLLEITNSCRRPAHAMAGAALLSTAALEARLRAILDGTLNRRRPTRRSAAIVAVLALAATLPIALAQPGAEPAGDQGAAGAADAAADAADEAATTSDRAADGGIPATEQPAAAAAEHRDGTGRVVDAAGQPIEGAGVLVFESTARNQDAPFATLTTDAEGRFVYPLYTPDSQQFLLTVEAPGYVTDTWYGNRDVFLRVSGRRVADTFVIHRPVTVAGRILDADGTPLADAEIFVDYFHDRRAHIGGIRVRSDADGRFRATDVPPARIFVRHEESGSRPVGVQPARFAVAHFDAQDGEVIDDIVLDLAKSRCVLEGVVVDETGAGVSNSSVRATLTAASGRLDESVSVMTDADGRFRFEGLPAEEVTVRADGRRGDPGGEQTVTLSELQPTSVRLLDYHPGHEPPADRTAEPQWGPPNGAGIEAAVVLDPHRDAYAIGDAFPARIVCRNPTDQPIYFANTFSATSELYVLNAQGFPFRTINYDGFSGRRVSRKYLLAPGQEVEIGTFPIVLIPAGERPSNTQRGRIAFGIPCAAGDSVRLVGILARQGGRRSAIRPNLVPETAWQTGTVTLQVGETAGEN